MLENSSQAVREGSAPRAYHVYGLSLRSHLPLACPMGPGPVLAEVELVNGSDPLFVQARLDVAIQPDPKQWFHHKRLMNGSDYLRWNGLFEFSISADGRRIACHASNGTPHEAFQAYLLSQVLSFALLKQGFEPLHATVVEQNAQAVAFLGDGGFGKSSLGAAFLQAGHRLLTDDLLVIQEQEETGGPFLAYPGPPRIKLFPKVATALFGDRFSGIPMNPLTRKQVIPLSPHQSSQTPVPLKAVYVLRRPTRARRVNRVTMRILPQSRALLQLLTNTFNRVITEPARLSRQFNQAARLAASIPVKSLSYPRDLSKLQTVVEAVVRDLA